MLILAFKARSKIELTDSSSSEKVTILIKSIKQKKRNVIIDINGDFFSLKEMDKIDIFYGKPELGFICIKKISTIVRIGFEAPRNVRINK